MRRSERIARLLRLRVHARHQQELALARAMQERRASSDGVRLCEDVVARAEADFDRATGARAGEWIALRAVVADGIEHLRLAGIRDRRQRRIEALRLQDLRLALRRERQMEELVRVERRREELDDLRAEQAALDDLRREAGPEVATW